MGGIYRNQSLPVLKNVEGRIALTDNEKAQMLLKYLLKSIVMIMYQRILKSLESRTKQHPDVMM